MIQLQLIAISLLLRISFAHTLPENDDALQYVDVLDDLQDGPDEMEVRRRNAINKNFLRFGRNSEGTVVNNDYEYDTFGGGEIITRPTTRSGHNDKNDNFVRFGRGKPDFLRFGRSGRYLMPEKESRYARYTNGVVEPLMYKRRSKRSANNDKEDKRNSSNFLRFGRNDNFMRFGRNDNDKYLTDAGYLPTNYCTIHSDPKHVHEAIMKAILWEIAIGKNPKDFPVMTMLMQMGIDMRHNHEVEDWIKHIQQSILLQY